MSKVVKAANAMISNKELITDVTPGSANHEEYFFLYDGKHKWSIAKSDNGNFNLFYYPSNEALEYLAAMQVDDWGYYTNMVHYNSKEIGTPEAKATFAELYSLVSEKKFGMDDILDEIINTDMPF